MKTSVAKHRIPKSLQAALADGWRIHEELSIWDFEGGSRREGFPFLTKRGAGKLTVPFVALYSTRRPYRTFGGGAR